MKEILGTIVREQPNDFLKRSITREYLQARILLALQDHGAFTNWAFLGGTALRFLYRLPRYSEDLDFSLVEHGRDAHFEHLMTTVCHDLTAEAYAVSVKTRRQNAVAVALVKFRGLLHELGLSPHAGEVLTVKVDIDTNPPAGAGTETRVIRRFVVLNLLHFDRPSMVAGKIHAVLTRAYTKGRDLYDLAWYLSDPTWPAPNLVLLNNALAQTDWDGPELTEKTWRTVVMERLARVDWMQAAADAAPFLEREQDRSLVSRDVLRQLLA